MHSRLPSKERLIGEILFRMHVFRAEDVLGRLRHFKADINAQERDELSPDARRAYVAGASRSD